MHTSYQLFVNSRLDSRALYTFDSGVTVARNGSDVRPVILYCELYCDHILNNISCACVGYGSYCHYGEICKYHYYDVNYSAWPVVCSVCSYLQ